MNLVRKHSKVKMRRVSLQIRYELSSSPFVIFDVRTSKLLTAEKLYSRAIYAAKQATLVIFENDLFESDFYKFKIKSAKSVLS